jgi:hypothetical protein
VKTTLLAVKTTLLAGGVVAARGDAGTGAGWARGTALARFLADGLSSFRFDDLSWISLHHSRARRRVGRGGCCPWRLP